MGSPFEFVTIRRLPSRSALMAIFTNPRPRRTSSVMDRRVSLAMPTSSECALSDSTKFTRFPIEVALVAIIHHLSFGIVCPISIINTAYYVRKDQSSYQASESIIIVIYYLYSDQYDHSLPWRHKLKMRFLIMQVLAWAKAPVHDSIVHPETERNQ